jgi:hypothetical protein
MRSRLSPSKCSTFSAGLRRSQPGGLLEPATDGRCGMITMFAVLIDDSGLSQLSHRGACHDRGMWRATGAKASVTRARL